MTIASGGSRAKVFERLFLSAFEHDQLAPALEEWRYVADANGGFSLADIEPATARELKAGLRAAASAELARLGQEQKRDSPRRSSRSYPWYAIG